MFIAIKECVDSIFKKEKVEASETKFERWKEEIGYPESMKHERKLLEEMKNHWCPIADCDCMLDGCIHFKPAHIWFHATNIGGFYDPDWYMHPPKCKLWK